MTTATSTQKHYEFLGKTKGCADHDHDLLHELSTRLDSVWRLDQYMANAGDRREIRDFWARLKNEELKNVDHLKKLVADEVHNGCF